MTSRWQGRGDVAAGEHLTAVVGIAHVLAALHPVGAAAEGHGAVRHANGAVERVAEDGQQLRHLVREHVIALTRRRDVSRLRGLASVHLEVRPETCPGRGGWALGVDAGCGFANTGRGSLRAFEVVLRQRRDTIEVGRDQGRELCLQDRTRGDGRAGLGLAIIRAHHHGATAAKLKVGVERERALDHDVVSFVQAFEHGIDRAELGAEPHGARLVGGTPLALHLDVDHRATSGEEGRGGGHGQRRVAQTLCLCLHDRLREHAGAEITPRVVHLDAHARRATPRVEHGIDEGDLAGEGAPGHALDREVHSLTDRQQWEVRLVRLELNPDLRQIRDAVEAGPGLYVGAFGREALDHRAGEGRTDRHLLHGPRRGLHAFDLGVGHAEERETLRRRQKRALCRRARQRRAAGQSRHLALSRDQILMGRVDLGAVERGDGLAATHMLTRCAHAQTIDAAPGPGRDHVQARLVRLDLTHQAPVHVARTEALHGDRLDASQGARALREHDPRVRVSAALDGVGGHQIHAADGAFPRVVHANLRMHGAGPDGLRLGRRVSVIVPGVLRACVTIHSRAGELHAQPEEQRAARDDPAEAREALRLVEIVTHGNRSRARWPSSVGWWRQARPREA